MTLIFSTGAVTGSRKMKVHVKWLRGLGFVTRSTNMDGSPTLFLAVHPKMNDTPLVKSNCSQEAPWGDFPGGPVAKTLHSQCRGPEFDPWTRS